MIAKNVGTLLLWTMTCCHRQRELLNRSAFEDTSAREGMKADISQKERDLMVYAGLVKLRLGGRVWDALVEGGGGL